MHISEIIFSPHACCCQRRLLVVIAGCSHWRRLEATDGILGMERPNVPMATRKIFGSGLDVVTLGEEVCQVDGCLPSPQPWCTLIESPISPDICWEMFFSALGIREGYCADSWPLFPAVPRHWRIPWGNQSSVNGTAAPHPAREWRPHWMAGIMQPF